MNAIFIVSISRYCFINAMNIVTDSIPAPCARNEFPLPLHGPAAADNRLPVGVAKIHLKLLSWNLTDPSDTANKYPCSSNSLTISHRLE
jgi:hypothetical protein